MSSFGQQHIRNHPRRKELVEKGKACTFFGVLATDLSHEDLLMLLGHLSEEREREDRFRRATKETLQALTRGAWETPLM